MHIDARTLDDGTLIEGDLCIVGAGAAGISMALAWKDTPYNVILLEGGGFNVEADVQDLYRGESIGQRYFALQAARLHYFGGTTGHWMGFCAPFDPIDFMQRDWVPHSGWPFGKQELDPFYARAHTLLELGPYDYDVGYWEKQDPELVRLPTDERRVWTKIWQFSPPTRFGTAYREPIVQSNTIHLYTHANVCDIDANEAVSEVTGLRVRCLNGKAHTVRAKRYVLACGAIQNARLLLASNRQAPAGLGNDRDRVGRFFMEHPEVRTAFLRVRSSEQMKLYQFNFFVTKARGELAISEALQREHRILNCTASLWPSAMAQRPATIESFPDNAEATLDNQRNLKKAQETGALASFYNELDTEFLLMTRLEQAPNPASRITLSGEQDALGVPRAVLNWQLTDLDKRSIRTTYELIGEEMGRQGLGRVQLMDWVYADAPMWPDTLGGGWHHMGTARMHTNPREGVVDADCKVHGLANLYVAGSAVYTTAGAANPTLTLVALALRLADHLKTKMG